MAASGRYVRYPVDITISAWHQRLAAGDGMGLVIRLGGRASWGSCCTGDIELMIVTV